MDKNEYYNFDVNTINLEVYKKLDTQQKVDVELLKHSKTLRDLLNELKYRKCEEIDEIAVYINTLKNKNANSVLNFVITSGDFGNNIRRNSNTYKFGIMDGHIITGNFFSNNLFSNNLFSK